MCDFQDWLWLTPLQAIVFGGHMIVAFAAMGYSIVIFFEKQA